MKDIFDLMLLMDVMCADCGKHIAMSNAYIQEFRYLCPACAEAIIKEIDKQYGLEFDNRDAS